MARTSWDTFITEDEWDSAVYDLDIERIEVRDPDVRGKWIVVGEYRNGVFYRIISETPYTNAPALGGQKQDMSPMLGGSRRQK